MMIGSIGSAGGGPLPSLPPVAAFSYSPDSPYAYGDVQFYDQSANSPTSWSWSVNGVEFSIGPNPTYYFTTAGSYEVSLVATNFFGSDTTTQTISVV